MADNLDEAKPVFSFLTSHWLSALGSGLVTVAGCSWLLLLPSHAGGNAANSYLGILFFLIVPAVFFGGLILIPVGAWLARRRIQAGLAPIQSRRVVLRRLAVFFGVMTVLNIIIGSQVTYRAVAHMETDQFCGQTCHVMKPQFVSNQRSVHRNVGCVECHITPGATGFVHAKMNGSLQMLEVTLNNYPRPIPPALQSGKLASSPETCEQCHARSLEIGSKLKVISKFKDDAANTPTQTVLMMHVGGGAAGGIHGAHMGEGVEIRYRSADDKHSTIPWVEYRNTKSGATRTYTASGAKDPGGTPFLMECADCHNRQGHSFEQPEEAVDRALAAGQISLGLPSIRKMAPGLLQAKYTSEDQAAIRIPAAVKDYYKQFPDVMANRSADIAQAGSALVAAYRANVFSDFGVTWGSYPTNLGHADNLGCFRCHDENHATPQKKTISQDCSLCHEPLAVDETSPDVLKKLGLDQKIASSLKH